ncbi:retrotransposon protein, putative, ty1-copia subclass [Tanacetum coccineum]
MLATPSPRSVREVLQDTWFEDKLDYLEQPIPPAPVPAQANIQRNLENLSAYDMLQELKTLFAQQAKQELLQTVRDFHSCKQEEGQSVSSYVLKMKSYIDNLERLGHLVSLNLGVSLILISLRTEFDSFVQNYNMHSMRKTVNELHAMLKLHEQTLTKKDPALHVIRAGKVQKKNNKQKKPQLAARGQYHGKGKNKLAYAPKPKIPPPPKRENPVKDSTCHQCGDTGHWKRNCPQYLAELLKNKKLSQGASGSVSRLYDDGYVNRFVDNTISVSRNNMVYFSAILRDGIFEIDLFNSNTNNSSVYVVSNKRAKLNLDSALLWHCRLGHISKKCIEKLQHDGLLNSTDLRAFEKCVSCMSRKMHKHEVFETFKVFQKEVENQLGKTIKSLRSDRGGEYMSQEFLDHLKEHGIIAQRTPPYTPQHNGVSERRNRTLLDMVCSMMSQTTLPKSFWDYALETAARILNMVPTKKVGKTPYEVWHGQAPKLSYLKVWGCEALVKMPKGNDGLFFLLPTQEQKEDTPPSIDTSLNHEEDDLEIDEPQSDIIPIRRSTRTRNALNRMCLYIDAEEHELGDLGEPANYKAALLDPESDKWLNAVNWLFKKKTDMDGDVHTFKARLVAKDFTQTYGVDYKETFSYVADIRVIRILIAIAAYYDYEIWQMDVKTAFLNGHLSEEVYMEQPEGFVNPKYPNRVCKLKRSIYGLKQAPRQ